MSEKPYYHWEIKRLKKTIGDLVEEGCPKCGKELYAEGSTGLGCSLHCTEHGCVWLFLPSGREQYGDAPTAWVNKMTGESSLEYKKRYGARGAS